MGFSARVIVFYGIRFGAAEENASAAKFGPQDADPERSETTPAAIRYWGHSAEGVEAVGYGHHEYRRFGIAVAGTVQKGAAWNGLQLDPARLTAPPDVAALRAYCEKHGLEWSDPGWYAVVDYG